MTQLARYVKGQELYFGHCRPWSRATVVVDDADLSAPRIVHPVSPGGS